VESALTTGRPAGESVASEMGTRPNGGFVQVETPDLDNSKQFIMAFSKEGLQQACLDEAQR